LKIESLCLFVHTCKLLPTGSENCSLARLVKADVKIRQGARDGGRKIPYRYRRNLAKQKAVLEDMRASAGRCRYGPILIEHRQAGRPSSGARRAAALSRPAAESRASFLGRKAHCYGQASNEFQSLRTVAVV
jgi:hypothetical protein